MKSIPGNMTKGVNGKTLDGMSIAKLTKLRDSIIDWSFDFKPTRRIYIPKANATKRAIGIPSTRDKIVQVVLKDLMEDKFEENFQPAFRKNKSLHQALAKARKMIGVTWIIEGDIKGYFDNIDQEILSKFI